MDFILTKIILFSGILTFALLLIPPAVMRFIYGNPTEEDILDWCDEQAEAYLKKSPSS